MSRRKAVTLSSGVNVALGPPISVLTHRIDDNAGNTLWRKIDSRASHSHVHPGLGTAISDRAPGGVVANGAHAARDGDHEPAFLRAIWSVKLSMTRIGPIVLVEDRGPRAVVNFARLLPGDADDPRAIDDQIEDDVFELRHCRVNAPGVRHVHYNDCELAGSVLGQSLQLAGGLRISACCEDTPTILNILPGELEAEPATGTCNERDRHRLIPIHCWLATFRLL
jgi:hypothetical protein